MPSASVRSPDEQSPCERRRQLLSQNAAHRAKGRLAAPASRAPGATRLLHQGVPPENPPLVGRGNPPPLKPPKPLLVLELELP